LFDLGEDSRVPELARVIWQAFACGRRRLSGSGGDAGRSAPRAGGLSDQATKLLYFAGYQHQHPGQPRPLIYDSRVAAAITRLPAAPLLPTVPDGITTGKYERYCAWAEAIAQERQTEPGVIEWALFALGGDIRDELRR
jgi:hypothetical protein